MQCPECQFDNAEGMNFCGKCGCKLFPSSKPTTENLSFDEKLEKIQKYLPKGLTQKILSQRDKIEGERKHVTVMFCDLVGFTQFSELIGPEKAYSIMDQVYEILIHIVQDHKGTVNEFTGDGIMALFGAPIALEDAPQQAVRSAIAIHKEMTNFSEKIRHDKIKDLLPLKMRIGIHTGPVVVGALGNDLRVEFKAVGGTVNLASRMENLADPGTTYVTEDTYKLTEGLFQFEAIGEKEVKGKKKPVPIFKLLSAKEEVYRPRLGLERMIYSEMVGRDKEFDKLQLQVMKVINGEGSVVNVIGEAGIGKSRLVAELKGSEVIKKVTLLEGRAISIGRNLSFHLIINLLKEWAQIKEDDSGAAALSKLEIAVRQVDPEEMHEMLPFVATLMGMKLSGRYAERVKGIEGEALEKLILKNIRDLLIKATKLSPLVIVAEDLHWADTSSIELMESLFPLVETQRIIFVNAFRPGHKETGDRVFESVKERLSAHYVEIVLQPLDERISETLINNMLKIKGLQQTVTNQIVERSGGNPFFIEEVVRSIIDEGAVVANNGAFEVTEKIDTVVIPLTINDVLMARIDRLEEKTRHLVKFASVIGRSFFYRILVEVAEAIENIDKRLGYLKEIQLIDKRRRLNELEYLFRHALTQEVAYESILHQKRKDLHLKVANSIEALFSTKLHKFYGMLAFHYSNGENLDKAEEYMIRAGEEALKSSASSEALHYYQGALKLYLKKYGDSTDPEKVATLEKNIAFAFYNKGQYAEAIEYFDKSLSFLGEKVPKHSFLLLAGFFFSIFSVFFSLYIPHLKWKGSPTQKDLDIFNLYASKIHALSQTDPHKMFIESFYALKKLTHFDLTKIEGGTGLLFGMVCIFAYTGIFFKLIKRILEFCKDKTKSDDLRSLISFELSSVMYNYYKGDWSFVKKSVPNLIVKNLNKGEIFLTTLCILYRGCIKIEIGSLSSAEEKVERLAEIASDFQNEQVAIYKYELNTNLLVKSRKHHEALKEVEKGIRLSKKLGLKVYLTFFYTSMAQVQMKLRNIEGAEESLLKAEEYQPEAKSILDYLLHFWIGKLELYFCHLEELIKTNDHREAVRIRKVFLKMSKRAVKISKKVAAYRTELFKLMGNYYWLIGKQRTALEWWKKSIFEGEQIGARLELSRTYYEVGKRLGEPKSKYNELKGIKAEDFLAKARTMFEEIDLQWDLDELESINMQSYSK